MDKILVVQDSISINTLLKFRLESAGFYVKSVETGEEGVKEATETPYDLILLDYRLPGINGIEVCTTLKSQNKTKVVPIVFLSATEEDEIIPLTKKAGADGFISLPLKGQEFIEELKRLIKERKKLET